MVDYLLTGTATRALELSMIHRLFLVAQATLCLLLSLPLCVCQSKQYPQFYKEVLPVLPINRHQYIICKQKFAVKSDRFCTSWRGTNTGRFIRKLLTCTVDARNETYLIVCMTRC